MFKNLSTILTANCEVIRFNETTYYYPIFKNGRSSLTEYAKGKKLKIYKNEEIMQLKNIIVFLRNPKERFVSGVWTFFYYTNNSLIDKNVLQKIENLQIINKHFLPQYIWLLHLYKYFRGTIELKPVEKLLDIVPNRDGPWIDNPKPWRHINQKEKNEIMNIANKKYTEIDEKIIMEFMNQRIKLEKIIKKYKI